MWFGRNVLFALYVGVWRVVVATGSGWCRFILSVAVDSSAEWGQKKHSADRRSGGGGV